MSGKRQGWFTSLPLWGKVLFLLIWPVSIAYGVYWMWKDERFSRDARVVLTAGAVLLVVFAIATPRANGGSVQQPAATAPTPSAPDAAPIAQTAPDAAPTTPSPPPPPRKPLAPKSVLRQIALDVAGAETNGSPSEPRVGDVQDFGNGKYFLMLNGDDVLTLNMTKRNMWDWTRQIWQQVFTQRKDIKQLGIQWSMPLTDVKGNVADGVVMTLTMTSQNASDVNWSNLSSDNIPKIADTYSESAVLSK